ncbi:hypothetical protein AKJ09_04757 [Labilithrix luteola]|uniref:Uncharacterized protein n=1 Tax=Labilithrix luteola TaxID=1391654 RepID=A0A0K1PX42_9BACT|nr:hypothetical protein AKJ09_04757 [Labilithrix luteola]
MRGMSLDASREPRELMPFAAGFEAAAAFLEAAEREALRRALAID